MPEAAPPPRNPVLEPGERLAEILFGLIMVMSFTGSLSVATADRGEVRVMLIAAFGCNIAWGLIDAIMFVMARLNGRGGDRKTVLAVKRARSHAEARALIRDNLPPLVSGELTDEMTDRIRQRIAELPLESTAPPVARDDLRGAFSVFLIVVASTFPVILPFVFMSDLASAMRVSNAIGLAMLALIGHAYGRASGFSPWWTAGAMVILGAALVALTIALGG
ncbi:VIT1/CCC1 transporter family protein [Aestuariivirga sp.]|uniref:VIT1/CCC1 transporter family protein n=1 Tax=Aestuariivirga sp. TaxID=2650926 RepID=UPI0025BB51DA|nr:VIT1/CCC1 transporter family protein [Aestuariivirga sp.]MCA3554393.1 VIT1/CCC1 transporter family protein [Aestuariivirga sp.]